MDRKIRRLRATAQARSELREACKSNGREALRVRIKRAWYRLTRQHFRADAFRAAFAKQSEGLPIRYRVQYFSG